MPDYDSHSEMLEELKITDDYIHASKVFVRAELSPADGDVFSDIDSWEFSVDQDITPEWFDEKNCAERMRNTLKEWAKTHIFIGRDGLKISYGENIFVKDCKDVIIYGSAAVENICGNATIISSPYTKWNNSAPLIISDNATFKDCYSKTIYQAGGWKLVEVKK